MVQPPGQTPWGLTTDQYVSANHSLTDSPAGNYAPNVDTSAASTVIDVTGVGSVSLSYWLSGQTQPQPGGDVLRVDYSINGGATWPNLATWSGTLDWAQHTQTIPPPGPGTGTFSAGTTGLQIRFRFTSNGNQQFDGMYVDDVTVQAL
jgi:carboxypeptidase T